MISDYDVIDFSGCPIIHIPLGGSDKKFAVRYNDDVYMLKFSENHAKKHDISTSYVNNVVSEYVSSHIAETVGVPVHKTVLGYYEDEIVVGCRDFRNKGDNTIDFIELLHASYDSSEVKKIVLLSQFYDTLKNPRNGLSEELQKQSIERFWETFVIDSLVGNFDRHAGNWAYFVACEACRPAQAGYENL